MSAVSSVKPVNVSSNDNASNAIVRKFEAINFSAKSTPTIIARDLRIDGELVSAGLIEIEGAVCGSIKSHSVILRESGFVDGTIIAESLSIRGRFDGTIKAKNISISGKAKVTGNVEYHSLVVEDGACIDGQFKMEVS